MNGNLQKKDIYDENMSSMKNIEINPGSQNGVINCFKQNLNQKIDKSGRNTSIDQSRNNTNPNDNPFELRETA